jgi:hypothetical protein
LNVHPHIHFSASCLKIIFYYVWTLFCGSSDVWFVICGIWKLSFVEILLSVVPFGIFF